MSVKNGVWHDVKLDPPTDEGSYLVATDKGGVMISHFYPRRVYNGVVSGGGFTGARGHITHWMPRPEPPGGWREKVIGYRCGDRMKPENRERSREIWELRQGGMTLAEIGRKYGICATTVHQILAKHARMKRAELI